MTAAADWTVVAADCRLRANHARSLGDMARLHQAAPEWFAKRAVALIAEGYRDLALTLVDLAEDAEEYATSAAAHEGTVA